MITPEMMVNMWRDYSRELYQFTDEYWQEHCQGLTGVPFPYAFDVSGGVGLPRSLYDYDEFRPGTDVMTLGLAPVAGSDEGYIWTLDSQERYIKVLRQMHVLPDMVTGTIGYRRLVPVEAGRLNEPRVDSRLLALSGTILDLAQQAVQQNQVRIGSSLFEEPQSERVLLPA